MTEVIRDSMPQPTVQPFNNGNLTAKSGHLNALSSMLLDAEVPYFAKKEINTLKTEKNHAQQLEELDNAQGVTNNPFGKKLPLAQNKSGAVTQRDNKPSQMFEQNPEELGLGGS